MKCRNHGNDLITQHGELAASIVAAALEAVAGRLTPTSPHVCRGIWCDVSERSWEGPHVEQLCDFIAAEIKRRCADIATGAK